MATRESNVIMFPQRIDPERKEDLRIAEQFFAKIDGLVMKGSRRDLAAWVMRAPLVWAKAGDHPSRTRAASGRSVAVIRSP